MTPDLDAIRAALAAASKTSGAMRSRNEFTDARMILIANAPTWLAALCDEVEQLRKTWIDHAAHVYVAERDAALAENERLRDHVMVEMAEQIREARRIAQQLAYAIVNSWSNQSPLKAALERGWQ